MQRNLAIDLISQSKLPLLTQNERQSIILAWWHIDEFDPEFVDLPPALQMTMREADNPIEDNPLLDTLVLLDLRARYIGVKNEYLEKQLEAIGVHNTNVEGEPEELFACPCCRYRTLQARGQYDICPVCFWEDSGQDSPGDYSNPNQMTLAKAQANFEKLGAVSEKTKRFVDPDGVNKWIRSRN